MKPNVPIIPVLAALIQNEKGEFLVARRKAALSNGGKWEFPGGKLHAGETPEKCLSREIKEELGLEISVQSPFHIVNEAYSERSILLISYLCRYHGGELILRDHDEVAWVDPKRLTKIDLSKPDIPIAEKLGNHFPSTKSELP